MSNYKSFGATLLAFWIILFIVSSIIFFIYINKINNIIAIPDFLSKFITEKEIFPYIFWNKEMLYTFIVLTFLTFIFTLVHGIYIFSKRKEESYSKKDEKDVLNTTFAGYWLIIGAYLILFIPIFGIFGNVNDITLYASLTYGILMIIGLILLSVGLSQTHEKDKKMKELKAVSIVAPSLIGITGIIYGIAPACCKLFNITEPLSSNVSSNILIKELNKQIKNNNNPENSLIKNMTNKKYD